MLPAIATPSLPFHCFITEHRSTRGALPLRVFLDLTEQPMISDFPAEYETVEVRIADLAWRTATFRRGEFVDFYGLPLDTKTITRWRRVERVVERNN
jgi:hypothetical protein